jgi:DivIVA domain-containing protein
MAEATSMGADEVARKQFATAFRGFDQYEVRAFLAQVAAELASLQERDRSLRDRLQAVEEKPPARALDGDELEAALGAETARVLHAAREAAAEIRAKAEESVARLLREANDDAARMRSEAETVLARRTEEAEASSSSILAAAEEQAAAAVAEAQERGRAMVAEAQAVRERILKDLKQRRRHAAAQLEQMLAGRERLLAAYDVVRTTLDEATRELSVAEAEARLAADVASLRSPAEDDEPVVVEEEPVVAVEAEAPPAPEPEPEPAPEPEVAQAEDPEGDERRSSSLRLLRRKPEPLAAVPDLPPLGEEVEGVRIIRPEPSLEPVAVPRPVVVPEPEPEPEAEPEPVVAEAAEEPAEDQKPVDDLFARLREERAAALVEAEAVLADVAEPEPEREAEAAVEPEPEPEPVAVEDTAFEARDGALEDAERTLTRALKRALADEQNEVLDALRRLRGAPRLDALLPDADAHRARYTTLGDDILAGCAAAGAKANDGEPPSATAIAESLATEVVDELRVRLERTFDATGGDDEALVEAVSALYREWKSARSEPLARHHTAAAYALGAFTALDGELRWVVDPAEGNCPDCDDNALAGPTAKGTAYPTGQHHPPAHAGCRCLVLPAS